MLTYWGKQYQQDFGRFSHLYLFQSSSKSHLDPPKMYFLLFLMNFNFNTKHFQWKLMIKMVYLGGRVQERWNFSLIAFFVGELFESKVGKILLAANRRQFWLIFGKIQRLITFEPYEEWAWNFQDSIFFMKASYGLNCNKICGVTVTHGTIWWFDMEWPTHIFQGFELDFKLLFIVF